MDRRADSLSSITVLQYFILREMRSEGNGTPPTILDRVNQLRLLIEIKDVGDELDALENKRLVGRVASRDLGDWAKFYVTDLGVTALDEVVSVFGFNRL